uniref:Uncharacterized protein n=1 Tax=Arundo donax TaxID=35708 RepID=A0A0A9NFS5_ARUDO
MNADEEHLEEGGVAISRQARASTVVGGCEDDVPPDALAVEAAGVQRRDDVELAGEQVAHRGGAPWDGGGRRAPPAAPTCRAGRRRRGRTRRGTGAGARGGPSPATGRRPARGS